MNIIKQKLHSQFLMTLLIPHHIEYIVADGLEVISSVEGIGFRFLLIIAFLEREEIAEHVHNRFFGLSFADIFDALPDPFYFCCLSEVEVVLQLCPDVPGENQ